ncbi:MAG: hypothetical protein ACJAW8_000581 [Oleispira sp.]|jgi:hypothetical protein|tara:strand:+ start:1303 stop:1773 length:471 start_codon:yes stop_codon:yes gene_type:complete
MISIRSFKNTSTIAVLLFMTACSLNSVDSNTIHNTLSGNAKVAYKDEKGVILFSYDKSSQDSEAYSDWAEYLNEFSRHNNSNFSIQEITTTEKTAFNISPNQFTLFIKQGYPSYLYHGFIVEPQVYTAVKKKYMKQELSNMDKSFLPEELHSFRKE